MIVSTISSRDVIESLRFNSSYHLSEGVIFEKAIKSRDHILLGNVATDIFTSGRVKRIYTEKDFGIPYLGNNDVRSSSPLIGCKYISRKFFNDKKGYLKRGMILTGRVGQDTVGSYTLASKDLEGTIGSDNLIRIQIGEKYNRGYVYAFLSSKFGYALTRRYMSGAAQPFITELMLGKIPIPILSNQAMNRIGKIVEQSMSLREEAADILNETERQLMKGIDIAFDIKVLASVSEKNIAQSFEVAGSEINVHTLRARNYSERKKIIISKLKEKKFQLLGDVLTIPPYYGGRFKRVDSSPERGIELLSQGDIFSVNPSGKFIAKKSIQNIENELVRKGTILIPGQGTLGENEIFARAKFVWGYLENKLVAGHAVRFIPNKNIIPEGYLFAVLNSPLWFRILRNTVFGTNLLGFINDLLIGYPVPRLKDKLENEIDSMVKDAYDKLSMANKKELIAIGEIEKEISLWQK
jgi:type I restriction enzyme, S subunit